MRVGVVFGGGFASGTPPPVGAVAGYGDVADGDYFAEAVQWSRDTAITGLDGVCFSPDAPVSRGDASLFLWNMEGRPEAAVGHRFGDVTGDDLNAAVSWMAESGVTTGKSATVFAPDEILTRAQAAAFLWRLAGRPVVPEHSFADVYAEWQQGAVSWMNETGITTGTSDTTFSPDRTLVRKEVITFLWRYQGEPAVTVDPVSPECDPGLTVEVPYDGSTVTVPTDAGFVADLGSVTVEAPAGVFAETTEVSVSFTDEGAGEHSSIETTAAQPLSLDFGGTAPAAPVTLRFPIDRPGLTADLVTPVVWDSERGAWVPTVGHRITVEDDEIVVTLAPSTDPTPVTAQRFDTARVTAAAGGAAAYYPEVTVALCDNWLLGLACKGAERVVAVSEWTVTVFLPAAWKTTEDAVRGLWRGAKDFTGDAVAHARQHANKVIEAIDAGIRAGLDAGIAFYRNWLLPTVTGFFGLRAETPECLGGSPDWAGIYFTDQDERDPRVHLCTTTVDNSSGGDLRVETVNNRPFGFVVRSQGAPHKNFQAPTPPLDSIAGWLAHEGNKFLIKNLGNLEGYQWPLNSATFEVASFDPAVHPENTNQWLITGETAMLDAIRIAGTMMSRAADHVPFAAVALDAAECATPFTGIVEHSRHWTAILDTAGSCISTAATAVAAACGSTGVCAAVAVLIDIVAQAIETVVTQITNIQNQLTGLDLATELLRQPATLTITPTTKPGPPTGTYTTITAGHNHNCAIRTDATITCWGNNNLGQADTPSGTFTNVNAGGSHTCAIRTNQTITCWGNNERGRADAPSGTFTNVTAGWLHSCGLRTNKTITCWGDNRFGQANTPTGEFTAVTAGGLHTCGLRTNRTITCWGDNDSGQTNAPTGTYTAVNAAIGHTCGLRTNRTITCWGNNNTGEADAPTGTYTAVNAGNGHTCGIRTNLTITCWGLNDDGQTNTPTGTYTTITAGHAHTCAIRHNKTITCWGNNDYRQADAPLAFNPISTGPEHRCSLRADRTITCRGNNEQGQTDPPTGTFNAVTAGYSHSCGLRTTRTITCWGWNEHGQTDAPTGTFTDVTAGAAHTCGVRIDRTITCWGLNSTGQTNTPTGSFINITAGRLHTCGLRANRTVTCWGHNLNGQTNTPDGEFTAVTAGALHSCAIHTNKTITCWGNNNHKQTDAPTGEFTTITAGDSHSCGRRTNNTITCWGNNNHKQTDAPTGEFTTITAGGDHTCGVRTNNTITCWGATYTEQTDNTDQQPDNPDHETDTPDGTFTAVTAGTSHTCAIRTDTTITC